MKGLLLGIVIVIFAAPLLFQAVSGAVTPRPVKESRDQVVAVFDDAARAQQRDKEAKQAADAAAKANAPDFAQKTDEATRAHTEAVASEARATAAYEAWFRTLPLSTRASLSVLLLVVLGGAGVLAGYFAVRSTRGRRPGVHGAIAGAALVVLGGQPVTPYLLGFRFGQGPLAPGLNFLAMIGAGWVGGQVYVRQKGPWDGTFPAKRASLFGSPRSTAGVETPPVAGNGSAEPIAASASPTLKDLLFGRRRALPAAEPEVDEEDLDTEIDLVAAPDDEGPADDVAPTADGARQFGPRGRRPRKRTRAARPAVDDDDVE